MRVIIKDTAKDLQVVSITLSYDADDLKGERLKMFFCPQCRNPIAQYIGKVLSIMPGRTEVPLPIFVKCTNCKMLYSFNAIV